MSDLTLDDVREKLKVWTGCDLHKTATQAVLGEGNDKAEIMFIGEAPGQKEDELGRPFVGAAGQFLDELLKSIGLERKDVYISNVVKYRPPGNRDPTPEEKQQCMPWLMLELSLIKPKIIVPLGRHALGHFLNKISISDAHGKAHTLQDGVSIFPIYHPAAALHNGGLRQALYDDFAALKKFLDEQK